MKVIQKGRDIMINKFKYILENYLMQKKLPLANNSLAREIRNKLPELLSIEINRADYSFKGSVGQGQWAEIPWICMFNEKVSSKTTEGIYIAILFKSDMSGFYITINQGWTFFKEKYGTQNGRLKIKEVSQILADKISNSEFLKGEINLNSKKELAQGYELGTVYSKYYSLDSLPTEEQLKKDLKKFVAMLDKVNSLITEKRSFKDYYSELLSVDDGLFFEVREESSDYILSFEKQLVVVDDFTDIDEMEPTEKKEPIIDSTGKKRWPRDSKIAAAAIKKAHFRCEFDGAHESFISNISGESYNEAHHLIPMNKQELFNYSLDKIANIKSLCPNCHRAIHHGEECIQKEIIGKLYNDSIDDLKKVGLGISKEKIISYYTR